MGESSACLVRSFSAGTSSEPKEGDPLRALTASISFGRFMSESSGWEKWSCFSNNRYLEEAEKYSKPGSVAEKKAYFEAHYKRIAAKKAAALLDQQNTVIDDYSEENIVNETHNNSSTVSESIKSDSHVVIDEVLGREAPNTEMILSVDVNLCAPNDEINKVETNEVQEAELTTEQLVIADSLIQAELPNQHENVENLTKIISTQQEKMPIMDGANEGNLVSTSNKKQSLVSSKLFTNTRSLELRTSLKMSPVPSRNEDRATQIGRKAARDVVGKKISTPKSLHMSINFSSHAGETSKTSSPIIHKIGNSKSIRTFVKTSRDSSTTLQIPTRASVNGLSVHPSATPQPVRKSNKTLDYCSASGRKTSDGKSQSRSIDLLKSSGASGHKAQNPMVASSFNFRCEERAAKRKEKLQEKLNYKETEKVNLQGKSEEKAENDFKKMYQSTGFKAKPIVNSHRETESPINHMKKIPLTRPQSPKLARKPIPSMVHDTGSRPPWRPSVKIDGSKHIMEKSIRTSIHSINSLFRKNTQENTSPNIQLSVEQRGVASRVSKYRALFKN